MSVNKTQPVEPAIAVSPLQTRPRTTPALSRLLIAAAVYFVVGKLGLLERLGIGAPESGARIRTRDVVPWSAVVRADRRAIVVRDDEQERQ